MVHAGEYSEPVSKPSCGAQETLASGDLRSWCHLSGTFKCLVSQELSTTGSPPALCADNSRKYALAVEESAVAPLVGATVYFGFNSATPHINAKVCEPARTPWIGLPVGLKGR